MKQPTTVPRLRVLLGLREQAIRLQTEAILDCKELRDFSPTRCQYNECPDCMHRVHANQLDKVILNLDRDIKKEQNKCVPTSS